MLDTAVHGVRVDGVEALQGFEQVIEELVADETVIETML